MKRKMCPCGVKSVSGLISSVSLCQKHFNGLMYGVGEEHKDGLIMLRKSQQESLKIKL